MCRKGFFQFVVWCLFAICTEDKHVTQERITETIQYGREAARRGRFVRLRHPDRGGEIEERLVANISSCNRLDSRSAKQLEKLSEFLLALAVLLSSPKHFDSK